MVLVDGSFPTGGPVADKLSLPKVVVWVMGPLGSLLTHGMGTPSAPSLMPGFNSWQKQPMVGHQFMHAISCLSSGPYCLISASLQVHRLCNALISANTSIEPCCALSCLLPPAQQMPLSPAHRLFHEMHDKTN